MLNQSVRLCNSQNGRQHKVIQAIHLPEYQNGPATVAINGYFKAFATRKLIKKMQKKWTIKKVLKYKKKKKSF